MRFSEFLKNDSQKLYHATYKPLLESILKHGLGGDGASKKWSDSKVGVVYLALDADVAESYAESSDAVPESWLDEIIVFSVDSAVLTKSKIFKDENVRNDRMDTIEYHGVIAPSFLKRIR